MVILFFGGYFGASVRMVENAKAHNIKTIILFCVPLTRDGTRTAPEGVETSTVEIKSFTGT
jgi:hypothetical protein